MVASITVNDPGKCFPILRKTIQFIQSLKKKKRETYRKQEIILQKEREQNRHNTKNQNFKRKKERKIFLHKKLKDLFPPNIWTALEKDPSEGGQPQESVDSKLDSNSDSRAACLD